MCPVPERKQEKEWPYLGTFYLERITFCSIIQNTPHQKHWIFLCLSINSEDRKSIERGRTSSGVGEELHLRLWPTQHLWLTEFESIFIDGVYRSKVKTEKKRLRKCVYNFGSPCYMYRTQLYHIEIMARWYWSSCFLLRFLKMTIHIV